MSESPFQPPPRPPLPPPAPSAAVEATPDAPDANHGTKEEEDNKKGPAKPSSPNAPPPPLPTDLSGCSPLWWSDEIRTCPSTRRTLKILRVKFHDTTRSTDTFYLSKALRELPGCLKSFENGGAVLPPMKHFFLPGSYIHEVEFPEKGLYRGLRVTSILHIEPSLSSNDDDDDSLRLIKSAPSTEPQWQWHEPSREEIQTHILARALPRLLEWSVRIEQTRAQPPVSSVNERALEVHRHLKRQLDLCMGYVGYTHITVQPLYENTPPIEYALDLLENLRWGSPSQLTDVGFDLSDNVLNYGDGIPESLHVRLDKAEDSVVLVWDAGVCPEIIKTGRDFSRMADVISRTAFLSAYVPTVGQYHPHPGENAVSVFNSEIERLTLSSKGEFVVESVCTYPHDAKATTFYSDPIRRVERLPHEQWASPSDFSLFRHMLRVLLPDFIRHGTSSPVEHDYASIILKLVMSLLLIRKIKPPSLAAFEPDKNDISYPHKHSVSAGIWPRIFRRALAIEDSPSPAASAAAPTTAAAASAPPPPPPLPPSTAAVAAEEGGTREPKSSTKKNPKTRKRPRSPSPHKAPAKKKTKVLVTKTLLKKDAAVVISSDSDSESSDAVEVGGESDDDSGADADADAEAAEEGVEDDADPNEADNCKICNRRLKNLCFKRGFEDMCPSCTKIAMKRREEGRIKRQKSRTRKSD